jgi:hypothetical protein
LKQKALRVLISARGEIMLRTMAVLFVSFVGVSWAQEHKITGDQQAPATRKRLQSVTWDLQRHKLVWVVETGKLEGHEFVAVGSDRYEISPDQAQMQFAAETRGFSHEEAVNLHRLLDTLSLYCAESVMWWDQGQGEKVDPKHREERKSDEVEEKPEQKSKPRPADQIASLRWAVARTLR